jgi:hypothetical protein
MDGKRTVAEITTITNTEFAVSKEDVKNNTKEFVN